MVQTTAYISLSNRLPSCIILGSKFGVERDVIVEGDGRWKSASEAVIRRAHQSQTLAVCVIIGNLHERVRTVTQLSPFGGYRRRLGNGPRSRCSLDYS